MANLSEQADMDNDTGGPEPARSARPRNRASLAAEAAFRARIVELGGEPLYDHWAGSAQKHHIRCSAGHHAYPRPATVQQGAGPCWECSGRSPVTAEANFRERLAELGATPLYDTWAGANAPLHIRCRAGHDAYPTPAAISQGQGPCKTCGGRDPAVAEAAYRARVKELGGTPLFERWRGNKAPHEILCPQGHKIAPRPNDVMNGSGLCKTCAGQDPAACEARWLARLAELGATPMYDRWAGRQNKHAVTCAAGHLVYPRPDSIFLGHGVCVICAGLDPATAEANFRERLAELGATPLYDTYLGSGRGHHIRCAAGHDAYPTPTKVQQGGGVCAACSHELPTVFYVLENPDDRIAKFGISSIEGRRRLSDHRRFGYDVVHRIVTGLPEGVARETEKAVMAALALAGETPVRGLEYFDISCLALILDVADSWLSQPGMPTEVACAEIIREWVQGALFAA
jgi:hypothetical protein